MSNPYGHYTCGIYYYPPSARTKTWISLAQVSANARISHYSADVTLTQVFIPPVDNTPNAQISEAKYSFPIYPSSSVTSFVAHVKLDGATVKTILGVVKTKPTAKKEYEAAISRGETAGYLDQTTDDVLTMKLGNIPQKQGTEVQVDVGYVTELKHDSEVDGVRFTVPVAIAPRYGNDPTGVLTTSGTHVRGGLEMNVEVDMPGPVVGVQSPSHPIAVTIGSLGAASSKNAEFDNKQAFAKLSQTEAHLKSDFVLQVLCKDSASPRAIIEVHEDSEGSIDSAALMLTFVPKFTIPRTAGPKKVKKDIIFLVDRSGSMWDKIEPLKSALRAFLKSLPPNDGVRFDICSFGSDFDFLFNKSGSGSKQYSQTSLQTALDFVDKLDANYGGTEIFAPVRSICDLVVQRNKEITERGEKGQAQNGDEVVWETELLLLTDGEVWDTETMCDYVRGQTHELRAEGKESSGRAGIRVFTLGIGESVSHALVEGLAKAGCGYSMTVGSNERFEGKVVRMLKAALGERVGGYKLTFDGMDAWGASSSTSSTNADEEDFEMVDEPEKPIPAAAPKAPISLFDETADVDAPIAGSDKPHGQLSLVPPSLICSPHIIPPLFAFNRTTVYLLLTPNAASKGLPLPEKVTLGAVTTSGQPIQLTIPVSKISKPGSKALHQLAVKKYLDDLKAGESWIQAAIKNKGKHSAIYADKPLEVQKLDISDFDADELVQAEGERIGVKWGVLGKWTAFVALEEPSPGAAPTESRENNTPSRFPLEFKTANFDLNDDLNLSQLDDFDFDSFLNDTGDAFAATHVSHAPLSPTLLNISTPSPIAGSCSCFPASAKYSPGSSTRPYFPQTTSTCSSALSPQSPAYSPGSPAYSPASPTYLSPGSPGSPGYYPTSPSYYPTSPTADAHHDTEPPIDQSSNANSIAAPSVPAPPALFVGAAPAYPSAPPPPPPGPSLFGMSPAYPSAPPPPPPGPRFFGMSMAKPQQQMQQAQQQLQQQYMQQQQMQQQYMQQQQMQQQQMQQQRSPSTAQCQTQGAAYRFRSSAPFASAQVHAVPQAAQAASIISYGTPPQASKKAKKAALSHKECRKISVAETAAQAADDDEAPTLRSVSASSGSARFFSLSRLTRSRDVAVEAESEGEDEDEEMEEGGSPASAPVEVSLPANANDSDVVSAFIDSQSFEGYWVLTPSLLKLFRASSGPAISGLNVPDLRNAAESGLGGLIPGDDKTKKVNIFATALVMVWLENALQGEKEMWELVVEKALDWLNAQYENDGGEEALEKLVAVAKEKLNIK
ncbi:hypothetical protein DFH27DRAFT_629554 [Peziza echinospora]|nr:hypothetical protein DFH27DRAFT_629554 [Peziza echinospora]